MSSNTKKVLVFTDTDNGGVIHVANIKGGVGKSTVATNCAAALSKKGPTLIVDLDVQGSATQALGRDVTEFTYNSWELFGRRFSPDRDTNRFSSLKKKVENAVNRFESWMLPFIHGKGDVKSIITKIKPSLDLIPAGPDLFRSVNSLHISNFLYNLQLCRTYYKYIILDTPSVWNNMTRSLFLFSDLNLIPVTLNALSTKSLQHYLVSVKKLAQRNEHVRIRIVKNEVFGKQTSKIKGKIRTMHENRRFLENLCEQVVIKNESGVSLLPQSIMFDLEIPESATVRDAQDEGKSVNEFQQYSSVSKAFTELARRIQYVLNSPIAGTKSNFWQRYEEQCSIVARVAAVIIALGILAFGPVAKAPKPPPPIAPQQIEEIPENALHHTFTNGESMYRAAKHAICHFRAMVPSMAQVTQYALETITIYNKTRPLQAPALDLYKVIPRGVNVTFYPPQHITNRYENELTPVYRFFNSIITDPLAYITGDWCERGTGGGQPHYGVDVAGELGSEIITPISGKIYLRNSRDAGRTVAVVNESMVLFFAHMDKRYFSTGSTVKKGDAVGTIGMTGATSGPHVHIGYGIKVASHSGVKYGKNYYRLTDPKLFFYRKHYLDGFEEG